MTGCALHTPVLLEETLAFLDSRQPGLFVDGTLGMGGHAGELLQRNPGARIIGFDMDEISLQRAKTKLAPYSDRLQLYHSDFRYLPDLNIDFSSIKGILLDLGISSYQLDSPERGFSYNQDGPLDMRMDQRNKCTAARVLNKYSEPKLAKVLFEFGELRQSRRLARTIVSQRKVKKFETTGQLLKTVEDVCRWRPQKGRTHPAARVFQALRIEINQELKDLALFFEKITRKIPRECRIVVISFHSLEDRIIKHTFAALASAQEKTPQLQILTKKPVRASEEEVVANFRSRSAKLRAAKRI